jgi:hypothetical protein
VGQVYDSSLARVMGTVMERDGTAIIVDLLMLLEYFGIRSAQHENINYQEMARFVWYYK